MSRTKHSIKNIKYAIIGQFSGIIITFVARLIFIQTLGIEYLGLNSLFSNILSVLSLVELGIGSAIIFSLYKPLEENDQEKIKSLMKFYKKSYIAIGLLIGVFGIIVTPFLDLINNDLPNIPHLKVIFLLFVVNSSISYFFSYKRSLIIANQKRYIATFYRYSFFFLLNILQIIILLLFNNFVLFVVMQILITFIENICISIKANQLYPYLLDKKVEKLEQQDKDTLIRNVKALFLHRMGGVFVFGTDSIVITKYLGVAILGIYSNYLLILDAINMVIALLFQSVVASVGNLVVTADKSRQLEVFNATNLFGFWIYSFSSICLINLINPFIGVWLGEQFVLSKEIVLLLVISFYLSGMRQSVLTFKEAMGLFWHDRYKPIFESLLKIISSILLVKQFGLAGVFISTIICTITICFWVEPYIIFKYGFKTNIVIYFKNYVKYTLLMLLVGSITMLICNMFDELGIVNFVFRLIICLIVPNLLYIILFSKSKEFNFIINRFPPKLNILNKIITTK